MSEQIIFDFDYLFVILVFVQGSDGFESEGGQGERVLSTVVEDQVEGDSKKFFVVVVDVEDVFDACIQVSMR